MPSDYVESSPGNESSQELTESDLSVVDDLRKPWEIEDHWKLRRDFILTHISKYPQNQARLLCLAQLFVNVETLGSTYSGVLMQEIRRLGEDVEALKEFKERRAEIDAGQQFKPPPKIKQGTESADYRANTNYQQQHYGNRSGYNQQPNSNYNQQQNSNYGQQQNSSYNNRHHNRDQQHGNQRGQHHPYGRSAQNYGYESRNTHQGQQFQPRGQRINQVSQQQSRQSYYSQQQPAYGQVIERADFRASYQSATSTSDIPSYESVPSYDSVNQPR